MTYNSLTFQAMKEEVFMYAKTSINLFTLSPMVSL